MTSFEKLVALLPYNPGLAHDIAFYGRRMREEASIRRTGLIFLVLTFFIQFFAVIAPPQPTVADSSNDLINGGISSWQDAKRACKDNTRHYGDILKTFGIHCSDLDQAPTVSLKSTETNKDGLKLFSIGHNPQGKTNATSGKKTEEVPISIPGVGTVYARLLSSFDTGPYSTYQALKIKASETGKTYYILYTCGNLVAFGVPTPVPQDVCGNVPGTQTSETQCDVCPNKSGIQLTAEDCDVCSNLPGVQTTASQCDVCPNIVGTQTTSTQCDLCPNKSGIQTTTAQCDVCPNITGVQTSAAECDVCPNIAGTQSSVDQCDVCPADTGIQSSLSDCKACQQELSSANAQACVSVSKAAANITRNYTDANGTTAQPGDTIVYTLFAKNASPTKVSGYVFTENINDVLDYATVTDLHGGTMDSDNNITWPAVDIGGGTTASEQITVKVKDVIPQTPTSSSDSSHFDLAMVNVYGNSVTIHVPGSPEKTVEVAAASLPNTGPGTSAMIAAAICLLAGYFYSRSRLLANETAIALQDNAAGGF